MSRKREKGPVQPKGRAAEVAKARAAQAGWPEQDVVLQGDTFDDDNLETGGPRQQSFGFDTTGGFLGEEFLLWLWFRFETEGGEFPVGPGIGVAIDNLVQFAVDSDDDVQTTLRNGLPTRAAEARAGLRQGRRIAKLRVLIASGSEQFAFTIDGETMRLSAVRLSEDPEDCECQKDRNDSRAGAWVFLHELVDQLYRTFVRERLKPEWLEQEAGRIAAWMRS